MNAEAKTHAEESGLGGEGDALYRIRHSLAHVLAQAVLEMRPGSTLGFGPPIEDGFYYDFILSEPLAEADFPDLERRMKRILKKGQRFYREEVPVAEAYARLDAMQEPYKREYAAELVAKNGLGSLSFYRNGPFLDMCEGRTWTPPATSPATLQAAQRRRGVLARRLRQRDDDAHLRLGLRQQGRTRCCRRGLPARPGARPPRSSGANSTCSCWTTTWGAACRCGCRPAR